ncbi:MAG TPA: FAD-dependent oxidoreductase, partial [Candidatus Aminicenantes bacterium]|nr:FAD-dependent oxidoreductase [Candidatus Aminicenantes bacterium]
RRRPLPVPGSERAVAVDLAIVAVGLSAEVAALRKELRLNRDGTIWTDPRTLQTEAPWLFAAGDAVSGPAMIVQAIGQGKRAAFFIDHWLRGEPLDRVEPATRLPVTDKREVLARQTEYPARSVALSERPPRERIADFAEVELPFGEQEALTSAANCLNCGLCSECQECRKACPAEAIDFDQRERVDEVEVGAVVVATGFRLFPAERIQAYGFGKFANVITAMQMDRLVAPTRPYNYVLRRGRQDAGQHRLRPMHRLARSHLGQPHLLARLLHGLAEAGAAPAGSSADRRRHHLPHRHPRLRQGLRRVLRADPRHGGALRQGQGRPDHREGGRQPAAALRRHR